MNSNNVLGLDVGERRIGVAIANVTARLPRPLLTIDRMETDAFEAIISLADEHGVTHIIIGLPRGMGGQETAQTVSTRRFAEELKKRIKVPIALQDEAATSLKAKDELEVKNKPYAKADIDKLAATYILGDWLAGATVEQL